MSAAWTEAAADVTPQIPTSNLNWLIWIKITNDRAGETVKPNIKENEKINEILYSVMT